jgi:stress responsive alpha/beta barrel protein
MITHVVLLKPKEGVSQAEIAAALDQAQALQHAIPGLVSVQAGENLNGSNNQGYTHGFVMQFTDAQAFTGYAPHPAHQPVSQELRRICQSIIDFDVE